MRASAATGRESLADAACVSPAHHSHRRANFFTAALSPSFVSRPVSPAGAQRNENDIVNSDGFPTSARVVGSNASSPVSLALMLRSVRTYMFGPLAAVALPVSRSLSFPNSIVVRSPVFPSAHSQVPSQEECLWAQWHDDEQAWQLPLTIRIRTDRAATH